MAATGQAGQHDQSDQSVHAFRGTLNSWKCDAQRLACSLTCPAEAWALGDPAILVIFDAGYDVTRLSFLLADLPVEVLGRLRSNRVMQRPAPPAHATGRPRKHGGELALADPVTWPAPRVATSTVTSRYGTAVAATWDRAHPRLTHRAAWLDHDGPLPVIEGTLIRLQADHLPGDRDPKPAWLWSSALKPLQVTWTGCGRRSCAASTSNAPPRRSGSLRLTPARVRRGFRNIRATLPCLAGAPKPGKPGPGRPPGSRTAAPHPVTMSGKPPDEIAPSRPGANAQVKQQA
jgi:hypothetical protein